MNLKEFCILTTNDLASQYIIQFSFKIFEKKIMFKCSFAALKWKGA